LLYKLVYKHLGVGGMKLMLVISFSFQSFFGVLLRDIFFFVSRFFI
jgi:hypothetical protein